MMMDITPVRDEATYKAALADIRALWGAPTNTPSGDRLDVLITLVEAYEQKIYIIGLPDPIEAIKIRMDDLGLDRSDLCSILSIPTGRVSEILNRKRRLTLDMIRVLARELSLSEACLVQPYVLSSQGKARETPAKALAQVG